MEGWQLRLFLEAQAEIVRVEGMKAENMRRQYLGECVFYAEDDFRGVAGEIERLAREIGEC